MTPAISLPLQRVMIVLVVAMTLVVLAALPAPILRHVFGQDYAYGFVPLAESLFDLNGEANVPAWFSSSILLIAALLLLCIGSTKRSLRRPYSRHWIGLGAVFVLLSLDEAAEFHERAGSLLGRFIETGGVFYFTWVVPALAFLLVLGVTYFGFLISLPKRTRTLFIAAGAIFVTGAVGLEMVAGHFAHSSPEYWSSARRVVLTHTEELMEMGGVLLFIYALLDYWRAQLGAIEISVGGPPVSTPPLARPVTAGEVRP